MEHIQRMLVHGLGALRCYITMLAAEGERRGRRLLDQAMWVLLLAGIGFLGVALFAFGAAQWIESRWRAGVRRDDHRDGADGDLPGHRAGARAAKGAGLMSKPRPRVSDLTPEELELLALEHVESMFIELRAT